MNSCKAFVTAAFFVRSPLSSSTCRTRSSSIETLVIMRNLRTSCSDPYFCRTRRRRSQLFGADVDRRAGAEVVEIQGQPVLGAGTAGVTQARQEAPVGIEACRP